MTKQTFVSTPGMEARVAFKGDVYQCSKCLDEMQSKYSGHYASCLCGESAVDQTEHYTRLIGYPVRDNNSTE